LTYSAITGDAFVRKVEELFVVHAKAKYLGQGDSFTKIMDTILVGEDSKGDGVVIGSTVGSNVPALAVVVNILSAIKEFVQLVLLVVVVVVSLVSVLVVVVVVVVVIFIVVIGTPLIHLLVLRLIQVRAIGVVVTTDILITWKKILINFVFAVVAHTSIAACRHLGLIFLTVQIVFTPRGIRPSISLTEIDVLSICIIVSELVVVVLVVHPLHPLAVVVLGVLISILVVHPGTKVTTIHVVGSSVSAIHVVTSTVCTTIHIVASTILVRSVNLVVVVLVLVSIGLVAITIAIVHVVWKRCE
jgi:hypothetical protein